MSQNQSPVVSMPKRDERISRRLFEDLIGEHQRDTKYLIGRLLTIVDGITTDLVQRKAIKDLIEDAVYSSLSREDEAIRLYSKYLAEALKEKCDWFDMPSIEYNPLID